MAVDEDALLQRFEQEFEKTKKDFGFSASLDELDGIFYLRDYVLGRGFVGTSLHRWIAARIVETFNGWSGYLHNVVMPPPGNMPMHAESGLFDEDEKKRMLTLMNRLVRMSSRNMRNGLNKDRKDEAAFIDDALVLWKDELQPELLNIMDCAHTYWAQEAAKPLHP